LCVSLGNDEATDVFPWLGAHCVDISFSCLRNQLIHAVSALRVFQGIEIAVQWLEQVSLAIWTIRIRDSVVPSMGHAIYHTRNMHFLQGSVFE